MEKKYACVKPIGEHMFKVTFTGEKATKENFQEYLEAVADCYQQEGTVALLFDANEATFPGISMQKMQANWLRDNEAMIKENCAGTAYVINSFIIRIALKLIFAFQQQPVPYAVFKEEAKAQVWLNTQLANRAD